MSNFNPSSILFNTSGSEVAIIGNAPQAVSQSGMVCAGTDGQFIRLLKTTNDGTIFTRLADTATNDAFGRLRVSNPYTLLDSKQIHDDRSIFWDTSLVNSATASYSKSRASTTLSVTTATGSYAIRQTRSRALYQSGKSLLVITTQVFGTGSSGIVKRVGLFDANNGIFLSQSGSNVSLCLRSSVTGRPVETVVSQSAWNIDKFDGVGQSRLTLNLSKISIFVTDLQWLGGGRVRAGFEIDGNLYYAHQFTAANIIDSVYMSTPNLPVRYEIENVTGGFVNSFEQICTAIAVEGGYEPKDVQFTIDRGITPLSGVTNAGLTPVASIRLNPAYTGSYVMMFKGSLFTTTTANYYWTVLMNPTIAGTNQPVWQNVLSSSVQYDVNRNSTNLCTNGLKIAAGYAAASAGGNDINVDSMINLGSTISGVTDQVVLCVQVLGGGTESFYGTITWQGST